MSDTTGKAIASVAVSAAILVGMFITKSAEPLWAGFFLVWIWAK